MVSRRVALTRSKQHANRDVAQEPECRRHGKYPTPGGLPEAGSNEGHDWRTRRERIPRHKQGKAPGQGNARARSRHGQQRWRQKETRKQSRAQAEENSQQQTRQGLSETATRGVTMRAQQRRPLPLFWGVRARALRQGVTTLCVRLRMLPCTVHAGTGAFPPR